MQANFQIYWPPSHLADCCLFSFFFSSALACNSLVFIRRFSVDWLLCWVLQIAHRIIVGGHNFWHKIFMILFVVSSPHPSVDCYIHHIHTLLSIGDRVDSTRSGTNCYIGSLSPSHLVPEQQLRSPNFVLPLRLFWWFPGKINGFDGSRGDGRHERWCWVAFVAIIRWFGGHRIWTWFRWSIDELVVMDVCVVREKLCLIFKQSRAVIHVN